MLTKIPAITTLSHHRGDSRSAMKSSIPSSVRGAFHQWRKVRKQIYISILSPDFVLQKINLSPLSLSTHRMDVDLCIRDRHVGRDLQHRDLGPTSKPAARPSELHEVLPRMPPPTEGEGEGCGQRLAPTKIRVRLNDSRFHR